MASGKISDMNIYLHVLNQVLQKDKGKTRKGCTKTLSVLGKNMCENSFIFATVTTYSTLLELALYFFQNEKILQTRNYM